MLRLSPFLFYTLSIASAFSGTAVNHVLAAALSSVPTKSAFHKLSFFLVVKDASISGVLNLMLSPFVSEIAGVYDSYVSKTEGLFAQYESQFNERYSSFESTLDNWDKELLSAYTEFMAKIKLFQSDAENEFNTWFESIKDKLGEDIAGSLQLQIEELATAMQEVKKQAEAGTKETKEAIAALDERLKRVESGWGIDYKHDAVLGLCYMGAAYMSQHYERTVETAVLGATYVGNSYLANTF